jgi:alpha-1,3-glucosyltransferase
MKERGVEGSIGPSSSHSSSALLQQRQQGHGQEEREKEGMGRAWIRWMHKRGARDWVVPSLVFTSTLVKFCISLGSYSGTSSSC